MSVVICSNSACQDLFDNNICDSSCNSLSCGWDGGDCLQKVEMVSYVVRNAAYLLAFCTGYQFICVLHLCVQKSEFILIIIRAMAFVLLCVLVDVCQTASLSRLVCQIPASQLQVVFIELSIGVCIGV